MCVCIFILCYWCMLIYAYRKMGVCVLPQTCIANTYVASQFVFAITITAISDADTIVDVYFAVSPFPSALANALVIADKAVTRRLVPALIRLAVVDGIRTPIARVAVRTRAQVPSVHGVRDERVDTGGEAFARVRPTLGNLNARIFNVLIHGVCHVACSCVVLSCSIISYIIMYD